MLDYSIMSFFSMIALLSLGSSWWNKVPWRLAFFAWLVTLVKILTTYNLRKRRIIVVDWFCMCKKGGEFVDRLLLHCEVASVL
jgi:hypothetical protein